LQTRKVSVAWKGGAPSITVSVRDLADKEVRRRLKSGLPQTFVTRAYAYGGETDRPVAMSAMTCRVVYDLWEEVYQVHVQNPKGGRARTLKTIAEVEQTCLQLDGIRIGGPGDYQAHRGKSVYFAVLIEFNPLSDGTVERIRRWLARPAGGGQLGDEAFFGSFVSVFVSRRIGQAERVLRFRSPSTRVK
jgi:hypothetical protein